MQFQYPEDEEKYKQQLLYEYAMGGADALANAELEARQKAGVYYGKGDDEKAKYMRQIAEWLGQKSLDLRKEQKKHEYRFSGGL